MSRLLAIGTVKGKDAFIVERVVGREEISRLFEYRVDLLSEHGDYKAEDMLGTDATVGIEMTGGADPRYLNGYISRFSVLGQVRTPAYKSNIGFRYQLTLSPWLWFLTRTSTCAIFQQKKMLDVIKAVLGRASALTSLDDKVNGDTELRDYCVQYRETDFNFFSRLMEQAGLYYYFTHEDGKHTLVLTDNPSTHPAFPERPELRFAAPTLEEVTLKTWILNAEIQPGAYAIDDFDYNKPNTSLLKPSSHERTHKNAGFELYDYPGEYVEPAWGETYAKIRMDELYCQYELSRGAGSERGVRTGYKFKLVDHPVAALNKEYLVVSHNFTAENNLAHSGGGVGATFECSFGVIPAATQFRPPRLTPLPSIAGPQTATVVGPSGEEIHTDAMGRVKLQFHWDRYSSGSDKDSCWVRVSNPIAGKGWGAINIPRVGQEVIVQFMEGDPDRPIVTGRVYNGENQTPYDMPSKKMYTGMKTRSYPDGSTDQFNELRFDDTKGKEQVFLQAQWNMDFRVKSCFHEFIGGSSSRYVGGSIFDKTDKDWNFTAKGDINIATLEGHLFAAIKDDVAVVGDAKMQLQAKSNLYLKTPQVLALTGAQAIELYTDKGYFTGSSELHFKTKDAFVKADSTINLKGTSVVVEGATQISFKVGGNFINISSTGVDIVGTMVNINSGGAPGAVTDAKESNQVQDFTPPDVDLPDIAMTSFGGSKSDPPKAREKPKAYSGQASAFKLAAGGGSPFVEPCDC